MADTRVTRSPVLVPLDGSALAEQALFYAARVVAPDTELALIRVVPEPEPIFGMMEDAIVTLEDMIHAYEGSADLYLKRLADRIKPTHERVTTDVVVGDPAERIIIAAADRKAGLIVMASHGRGALGRLTFGSVADRVSRLSTVPVLIIRPRDAPVELTRPEIWRLLVPVDDSPLAREALPVAMALALEHDLPIHLVQAVSPAAVATPSAGGIGPYPTEYYDEVFKGLQDTASRNIQDVADLLIAEGIRVTAEVVTGPPVASIEHAAQPGDIIVMASHGREGVGRWLLGSVSERLVRTGPVPVLLVPTRARQAATAEIVNRATVSNAERLLRQDRYRPEELADLLSLDVDVVRHAVFAGQLKAKTMDHAILEIRREDALRWLAARS